VLDPIGIAISEDTGPSVAGPHVAYGGGDYLVAWSQWIGSRTNILGKRISRSGTVRDRNAIRISIAANDQSGPKVASDGRNYFVAWNDGRGRTVDVYGSRVTRAGSVLNPAGRPVTRARGNQWVESVDFNGANYFVAWEKEPSSPYAADRTTNLYGARVSRARVRRDRAFTALPSAKRRRR
jgi:hypothetical protein